jgi:hypothetical protein
MNYLYLVFALLFAALAAGSCVAKRRLERKFPSTKNRAEMVKQHITDRELELLRDPNLPDLYDPQGANLAGFIGYIYQVVELHFKSELIGFVLASVAAFIDFFGL